MKDYRIPATADCERRRAKALLEQYTVRLWTINAPRT